MISRNHVIAIACLLMVLILASRPWRTTLPENSKDSSARRKSALAGESSVVSPDLAEPTRTKSSIRTHHPKPTIEETTVLVRSMIIPEIDLPADQPLPERLACINELIQKAGVEPHRLRLILRNADPANRWRCRNDLRMREVPLGIVLKYLCDVTRLRYHVRENGIIELTITPDEEPPPDPLFLPKKTASLPSGETDIFGNDPSAPEEPDPFAEPKPAR